MAQLKRTLAASHWLTRSPSPISKQEWPTKPDNSLLLFFWGASDVPVIVDSSCRAGRGGPTLWDDDEVDGTQRSSRASVGSIGTGWNRSHVVADDSVLNTAVTSLLSDTVPVVLPG